MKCARRISKVDAANLQYKSEFVLVKHSLHNKLPLHSEPTDASASETSNWYRGQWRTCVRSGPLETCCC